jgi:hypothetical protein
MNTHKVRPTQQLQLLTRGVNMKLMRPPPSSLPVQTPFITPLAFGAAAPVQQPIFFRARSLPRAARAATRLTAQRSDDPDELEEEVAVVKASIFALEALGKELDFFGKSSSSSCFCSERLQCLSQ